MRVQVTVGELAAQLGGAVEGDGALVLTGAAPLEAAVESQVSFVETERALDAAKASRAGCLLASQDLAAELVASGRSVIRVRKPRRAMAQAIELFHSQA